jgi:hypothetical protein
MKIFLIVCLLLSSLLTNAQLKKCEPQKLTYQLSKYRKGDTLGDLTLRNNGYEYFQGLRNIVFVNKKLSKLKYFEIKGAEVCKLNNDTTLVITPNSPHLIFRYLFKSDTLIKEFETRLKPKFDINIFLDNRIQERKKPLLNYKTIDSLSFEVEHVGYEHLMVQEDFNFSVSRITIWLVRGRTVIGELEFRKGKTFYINDLLQKALPGDKLSFEYIPEWLDEKGNSRYTVCGGLMSYTLGTSK